MVAEKNIIKWNNFILNCPKSKTFVYCESAQAESGISAYQQTPAKYNYVQYNYWNDWVGPDNNLDGIVDLNYSLVGPDEDISPLTEYNPKTPFTPLLLDHPRISASTGVSSDSQSYSSSSIATRHTPGFLLLFGVLGLISLVFILKKH